MVSTETILRPYFWNVPFWAQVVLYVLGLVAVGIFIAGLIRARHIVREGLAKDAKSKAKMSLTKTLFMVLMQRKVRETRSGVAHFAIFWGFILLFMGTVLATIDWDIAWLAFDKRILSGRVYLIYKLILDIAGLLALIGLSYAALRRYVWADPKVEPTERSAVILGSLAGIIVIGFFLEALRLAAENPPWAVWSPVGYLLSHCFAGMTKEAIQTTHIFVWVIHAITSLCFIAVIPLTFYAHLFKTPASIRREKVGATSAIAKIENIEEQEHFGASDFNDFSIDDRVHIDGCTECGRCRAVCPAFRAGSTLDPKSLVLSLQKRLRGENKELPLIDGLVGKAALWDCTTCNACAEVCPARIPIPDLIVAMRRNLALEKGDFPAGLAKTLENTASVGNPWAMDPAARTAWTKGLDIPVAKPGEHYDVLYWVGCAASYDKRAQRIAKAMVKILRAAKVNFAIMAEERCHADWARRAGEEYLFQQAAEENIGNFSKYDFDEILTACPHCFNTLKNEYPQFEGGCFVVRNHVDYILSLIKEKRLTIKKLDSQKIALHDACYLARANGVVKEPRKLLKRLGLTIVEPEETGRTAFCCGAGGAQMFLDKPLRVNAIRIKELKSTKAQSVAVECPHCLSMLGAATTDKELPIEDIAEMISRAIEAPNEEPTNES